MASHLPALTAPDCLARLRAAFDERDQVQARLTAAEAEAVAQRARAAKAREAAEGAAAGIALGRITDAEADAVDTEAAAATKAARHAERLVTGLRKVLADTEASIAALAAPAREDLLAWARAHASSSLAVRYSKLAAETFNVIREMAALRSAADVDWGDDRPISLPVDILDPYGAKLRIGIGEATPLPSAASELAGETTALIRRAQRLTERAER